MQTKNFSLKEHRFLLLSLVFFSICFFTIACGGNDSAKTTTTTTNADASTCPTWATWTITFDAGTSTDEKTRQKSALEAAIEAYVNNTDAEGNTCTVTSMIWTDVDETHSQVVICISCKDRNQNVIKSDTTAIRPPSGVKPPAGLTSHLLEPGIR